MGRFVAGIVAGIVLGVSVASSMATPKPCPDRPVVKPARLLMAATP